MDQEGQVDRVTDEERPANRLAAEASPYLLQHAHNPVDWFPWGREAFERARREDKPVLVSIGYAACHWCHVMERESFEDADTAALMNEHFVSVKVDREERPDVDSIYMDAVQAMTGRGGWPLTAFLTPEGKPFYAGTYFPNEDRHGLPSFRRILTAIAATWRERRSEVETQGQKLVEAIARPRLGENDPLGSNGPLGESSEPLGEALLSNAVTALRRAFDARWGGFGGAPKFPQPMTLEFLLRAHLRGRPEALDLLTTTLDRMAAGGVYDQIGGGFHRYSVDERWQVPHFEKMLYDNAQLLRVYTRAWQVTRRETYRRVAHETGEYLLREMRQPGGGFSSSQDADTDGIEGASYVWTYDDLTALVGPGVAAAFGAIPGGNWEGGSNVLWRPHPIEAVAAELGLDEERLRADVERARGPLFAERTRRPQPATDDKVIAGWNGLAIAALAEAGRVFDVEPFVSASAGAGGFALRELRDGDGRLLRSWRDGRAGPRAFADDHALLADGLLTLFETTFELRWFAAARELCDELLRSFRDRDGGGFYQTAEDAEALVVRPKELFDNAVPSGNSAAADVLLRMSRLTGEAAYEEAAASALRVVGGAMAQAPTGFGLALCALDAYLSPPLEVAIVGDPTSSATRALVREVTIERFVPNHVLAVAAPHDAEAADLVPLLAGRSPLDGSPTAYVCERFACNLPVTEPVQLAAQLGDRLGDRSAAEGG
ncbi:MAG TPA: thioredoxin domain-containing protein [Acidimicrobiia bacterium]|nr:thioredoxin domain-containing protein [Acidimicrobiia bacterium]